MQRRGSGLRYVGLYRPGKHPGGPISPPPDFILSGEYIAHDPHGSSSNFNTLEGEWYWRSKILAACGRVRVKSAERSDCPLRSPAVDRLARPRGARPRPPPAPLQLLPAPLSAESRVFTSRRLHGISELFNWPIHFPLRLPAPKRLTDRPGYWHAR